MAKEEKIATAEPETKETEQAGECCEPVCGPTTCGPDAEAAAAKVEQPKVVEEPKKASSGCGPSTCG